QDSYFFLVQKSNKLLEKIKEVTNKREKPKLILDEDTQVIEKTNKTTETKTIITTLVIGALLLSQMTFVFSNATSNPDKTVFTNPESILTVELDSNHKANTLDNLINVLPKNNRENRRYGITSLQGIVTLNQAQHGVNLQGEYTKHSFKKAYQQELSKLLSTLEQVKDGEDKQNEKKVDNLSLFPIDKEVTVSPTKQSPLDKGVAVSPTGEFPLTKGVARSDGGYQEKSEKNDLKQDLKRFSKWDIQATRYTYLFTDNQVGSITLTGYQDTINRIKTSLEQDKRIKTKSVTLTDIREIEKQTKAIQTKIENRTKQQKNKNKGKITKEQEQKISQEVLTEEINKLQSFLLKNSTTPVTNEVVASQARAFPLDKGVAVSETDG
ncbi:MAG: hypothetical protein ACRCXZ_04190, partial [Patescibacteria group bacterium]